MKKKQTDLFEAIKRLDPQQGESDLDYRLRLKTELEAEQTKVDAPQEQANLCRIRLGLALLAARPATGVLKWQREQAEALGYSGKGTRAIRELIGVAEAAETAKVGKNGLARIVPIEAVQRPWGQVRRTLKVFKETDKLEGKLPGKPWTPERALTELDKALKRAKGYIPQADLEAWWNAAGGATKTVGAVTTPTVKTASEAHLKTLPKTLLPGAKWTTGMFTRHVGEDSPVGNIRQQDVDAFLASDAVRKGGTRIKGGPRPDPSLRQIRSRLNAAIKWWHEQGWTDELKVQPMPVKKESTP